MDQPAAQLRKLTEAIDARPVLDDVSVLIPTLGRPILETCLSYIADGSCWPRWLIVVDQGRRPEVEATLARLGAAGLATRYIPSTQRGRSAGINRGLEAVSTRFVTITDDDCFVRRDWLAALTQRLRLDPATIWTGRVEAAGDERAFSTVLATEFRRYSRPQFGVHPFVGGNVGMAMDVVQRIGTFDEHPCIASAEDTDYGYRALRLGIPIAYDPAIVLDHFHWRNEEQRAERYADYARSQGGFFGTHLRRGGLLIALQAAYALARGPVRWLRGLLRNDRELRRSGREMLSNLVPGILEGLRRTDRPAAAVDDARRT